MGPLTRTGKKKKKDTVFCGKILLRIFFHSLSYTKAEIIQTFKQETKKKKNPKNLKTKLKDTEEPETE